MAFLNGFFFFFWKRETFEVMSPVSICLSWVLLIIFSMCISSYKSSLRSCALTLKSDQLGKTQLVASLTLNMFKSLKVELAF
jgi:hypothetical protein